MAQTDHDTYLDTRHFGSLDGLRFLCITAVIWHHLPLWFEFRDTFNLATRGHVGVDFFFVLSGFLITTLLLREESQTGTFSLRAFYWRRALRIIPVYFFVVSVAAFYAIVIKGNTQSLEVLPFYYLFLSNFITSADHISMLTPTWSLSMEEQFYILWPALLLLAPRRWIVRILVGLITINVMAILGVFNLIGFNTTYLGPLRFSVPATTYAPLLLGALLAVVLHDRRGFALLRPLLGFAGAPLVWFGALLAALHFYSGPLAGWPNLAIHILMTIMLGALVAREDHVMAPVMRLPPIVRIGQISYGIYLYHLFALAAVGTVFQSMGWDNLPLVGLIYYAIAIVIAEISFRTLEAWPMKFRKSSWGALGGLGSKPT